MEDERPMLLYYKMRGNAQIIRAILVEIGVDYQEVYMNESGISQDIQSKHQIQFTSLPYFICEGQAVCGIYFILKYCCNRYGRRDLLGSTLHQQTKIAEIGIKYVAESNKCIKSMFDNLDRIRKEPNQKKLLSDLFGQIIKFIECTKYFSAFKQLFLHTKGYLLGKLTILDVIFYEACLFIENFQGFREEQITKQYVQFFRTTPLYQKCNENLQPYPYFVKVCDPEIFEMLKIVWRGDPSLLQE